MLPKRLDELIANIDAATETAEISGPLMNSLPGLVKAPVVGFLLFHSGCNLALLAYQGPNKTLTQCYRERGLPHDEVLRSMLVSRQPVHNLMIRDEGDWRRHSFYLEFARQEGLLHYGGSPILVRGVVTGAIVAARQEGAGALDANDLLILATVGLHVQARLAELEQHIPRGAFSRLTKRQLEVCASVARGRSNREIAAHLRVGIDVIKWHLKQIFMAIGVESRDELVAHYLFWFPSET